MPAILIVRPAKRIAADAAVCERMGWTGIPFALMRLQPKPDALSALTDALRRADAVFWVSPSAVEIAAEHLPANALPDVPQVAVGRATADALARLGVHNVCVSQQGNDSEHALQLPVWQELPRGAKVLIVRGEGGRTLLAESLQAQGLHTEYAEIYRREAENVDWQLITQCRAVWLTSSESAHLFFRCLPPSLTQAAQSLLYFTHHQRIAAVLQSYGVHHIHLAAGIEQALQHAGSLYYGVNAMSEHTPETENNKPQTTTPVPGETASAPNDKAAAAPKETAPKETVQKTDTPQNHAAQPIVIEQKGSGKGLAAGALVLSLLALGASGFLFTQGQNVLKTQELQIKQELDKAGLGESQNATLLQNTLHKQGELANAFDALLKVQQQHGQSIDNANRAYQELLKGRVSWLVDEVEVTLNLASQQLLLSGNVPVAISALESVEQRLNRFEQAALLPIKQAVSQDLAALKNRPYLNIPATALRLDRLESAVAGLPLLVDGTLQASPTQSVATAESADFWTRAWDKTLGALKGMVEVRKLNNSDAMLIAPEQVYFVRENLRLRLLDARLALLQHNGEIYQTDLSSLEATVKQYFDLQSPNTQAWLKELGELKALDVRMISDNALNASLTAVRNYQNEVRTAMPTHIADDAAPASAPAASSPAQVAPASAPAAPAAASEAAQPASSAAKGSKA